MRHAQNCLKLFANKTIEQEKKHIALIMLENTELDHSSYNNILTMLINTGISKPYNGKILHVSSTEFDSLQQEIQLAIDSMK